MQTSKFVLRVEDANGGGPWQGDVSDRLDKIPEWDRHGNETCCNESTHPTPRNDFTSEDFDLILKWNDFSNARCAVDSFELLFHWFDTEDKGVWKAFAEVGLYLCVYECKEYVVGGVQVCFNRNEAKLIKSVSFESLIKE